MPEYGKRVVLPAAEKNGPADEGDVLGSTLFLADFLLSDGGCAPRVPDPPFLFSPRSIFRTEERHAGEGHGHALLESAYRPQTVRGMGAAREGYCGRCDKWFRLKTSSYWYHMNYKHGISVSGKVCPEPELRDRDYRVEGFCRECRCWIVLGSSRKSVRFGWFKHWQKMHSKGKTI